MKYCSRERCEELHDEIMGCEVFNFAFLITGRGASDFQEVLNDLHGDVLSVVVGKLVVVHEHEQPSGAHQLELLVASILTELVLNHFDELAYGLVVALCIGFHHALLKLLEVMLGSLPINSIGSHSLLRV